MKKPAFFILIFIFLGQLLLAQDPAFSQPFANPLYLNPALAGTGTSQRIGLNFRDQWPNISGSFIAANVSFDRNVIDSNNAIGVLATYDNSGQSTLTTKNVSLILSHQFHIKTLTLSIGAQATYHEKSINTTNLSFGDMANPVRGFVYSTESMVTRSDIKVPDFSAGIQGYGKNYFFGFAINHITQPDESFVQGASPLPIKYVVNAGGMIPIGSFTLSPILLYQKQQDFNQTVAECYISKWHLTTGVGYRFNNAVIFTIGYQNSFMRIGYSYDYTTSELTAFIGGSHEASLAILLPYKHDKFKKVNGINCPFF